jgi:hypothetical protein
MESYPTEDAPRPIWAVGSGSATHPIWEPL